MADLTIEIAQLPELEYVNTTDWLVTQPGAAGTPLRKISVENLINGSLVGTYSSVTVNGSIVPANGMYLPAANTIGWSVNSAAELKLDATALFPASGDGLALGKTTNGFSDAFFAFGAVVNFNNGDMTITHGSNVLTIAGGELAVETLLLTAIADGPSYDDDSAAAAGGIGLKRLYRNGNFLMVRLT